MRTNSSQKGFIGLLSLLIVFALGMYLMFRNQGVKMGASGIKVDKQLIQDAQNAKKALEERDKVIQENL
jgi:hypothetical protein